jgi:nitroimidazol reductase NimA-like FMN-containing flavoprotein (pyridoxamine 5'-phosphate oxidase superfamily)
MNKRKAPSERARVKRLHERAAYDAASIHAILDAMPLCHVGYLVDGAPMVTPTLQWREGDHVYWHGSSASRFLRAARATQTCLTVTMWDGMVMARSGFHHSANYRSCMVFGEAEIVEEAADKADRLEAMFDVWFPGRWNMLRPMTGKEVKATTVLRLPLNEASVKVRTGPPGDVEEDYALPIWAGVVPLTIVTGEPIDDPRNLPGMTAPDHASNFRVGRKV